MSYPSDGILTIKLEGESGLTTLFYVANEVDSSFDRTKINTSVSGKYFHLQNAHPDQYEVTVFRVTSISDNEFTIQDTERSSNVLTLIKVIV